MFLQCGKEKKEEMPIRSRKGTGDSTLIVQSRAHHFPKEKKKRIEKKNLGNGSERTPFLPLLGVSRLQS